ncbi:MAG: 3-hydroxy-9,10-secoandrosta-1,3,5(10)-triene-9,17-dione monooxygenase [Myxococcota bacterium]|jgi:3-hydroxy-9,10-secoandrosta-1,3,5(10)-triene-9,17-dione monooxygenase
MTDTPTAQTLLERARALLPRIAERRTEAHTLRRIPDATIQDLKEAGLFRILQPKRYGGYELDPRALFDIQILLGTVCGSTAWVYGVVAVHAWQMGGLDDRAQAEVWSDDQDALISSSYMPVGKVTPVEGGYRLSGHWSFSSGSDHCQGAFLGAFCPTPPEAKGPDMRSFLVLRDQYEISDTWHTSGLAATGSNDIIVDDVFVPEYRTHRLIDGYLCKNPGQLVNTAPLFALPFGQVFVRSVSTTAIGLAEGALAAFTETASKRVASGPGKPKADPFVAMTCAKAAAAIDEVKLVLNRNFQEMTDRVEAGESVPVDRRIQFRYDSANAVDRCTRVVDELFINSGGRAVFLDHPLNRAFQDIHAVRQHYANSPNNPGLNLGGTQLGLKNTDFFI